MEIHYGLICNKFSNKNSSLSKPNEKKNKDTPVNHNISDVLEPTYPLTSIDY